MIPNEIEDIIARERSTLRATLERTEDWDETVHDAVVRYANALFAAGLEHDAVVKQLNDFTIDAKHAGAIAHEAQTGQRLPFRLVDDDNDAPGAKRTIRCLGLGTLLIGLGFVSIFAYRVYQYAVYQKRLDFASVLLGTFTIVFGMVAIRWGIRSIMTPYRN